MEIQDFQTEISFVPNISTDIKGQNIIVTFSGKNRRKATDEILVIGAHYDSEASPLISIDDNGSGVVAMLEVARGLADAIVNRKAILLNTIMFVAFDIQNVMKYFLHVCGTKNPNSAVFCRNLAMAWDKQVEVISLLKKNWRLYLTNNPSQVSLEPLSLIQL